MANQPRASASRLKWTPDTGAGLPGGWGLGADGMCGNVGQDPGVESSRVWGSVFRSRLAVKGFKWVQANLKWVLRV